MGCIPELRLSFVQNKKNEKTFLWHLKLVVPQVKHTMTFQEIQVLATHVQKYFMAYPVLDSFS